MEILQNNTNLFCASKKIEQKHTSEDNSKVVAIFLGIKTTPTCLKTKFLDTANARQAPKILKSNAQIYLVSLF